MTSVPLTVAENYRKDLAHAPGHGYGRNVGTKAKPVWVAERTHTLSSLIVHSTNGKFGSTFHNECVFLRDSARVGCGEIIGHDGAVERILPEWMVAWQAGATIYGFDNLVSYGIELHKAEGEALLKPQLVALTARARTLIATYHIPRHLVETHRAVAVPAGRKTDPSDWSDASFYAWRDGLYQPLQPIMVFFTTTTAANVRTAPSRETGIVVMTLPADTRAGYDAHPTSGESIAGNANWFHRADGLGFTHSSLLVPA